MENTFRVNCHNENTTNPFYSVRISASDAVALCVNCFEKGTSCGGNLNGRKATKLLRKNCRTETSSVGRTFPHLVTYFRLTEFSSAAQSK